MNVWSQTTFFQVPTMPVALAALTLDKLPELPVPQFPH